MMNGHCHPDGPYHDCEYVEARNAAIPRAVAVANARCGSMPGVITHEVWAARWSQAFHEAMPAVPVQVRRSLQ